MSRFETTSKKVPISNAMHQMVSLGKHCIENYQIKKPQEPKERVIWLYGSSL